jgi:hypothetical protein
LTRPSGRVHAVVRLGSGPVFFFSTIVRKSTVMRMFCQKLFDVADFPYAEALKVWQRCAAGSSTATDAVGCGLLHNVRKDQGYSIYVHVRWVLSGKYCSTGSVLGVIRLPRLPVRNCIKAQNKTKKNTGRVSLAPYWELSGCSLFGPPFERFLRRHAARRAPLRTDRGTRPRPAPIPVRPHIRSTHRSPSCSAAVSTAARGFSSVAFYLCCSPLQGECSVWVSSKAVGALQDIAAMDRGVRDMQSLHRGQAERCLPHKCHFTHPSILWCVDRACISTAARLSSDSPRRGTARRPIARRYSLASVFPAGCCGAVRIEVFRPSFFSSASACCNVSISCRHDGSARRRGLPQAPLLHTAVLHHTLQSD